MHSLNIIYFTGGITMAYIKPFRALRYTKKAGDISTLTCPPYDIISDEQKNSLIEKNPCNAVKLELPSGENPYTEAGNLLEQWINDDILTHDEDEGIYIYEEEFQSSVNHGETKKLMGFICRVRLEDFSSGIILPHEETLSKDKKDRLELMKSTNCNFSPVYSLYTDKGHVTGTRLKNLTATTAPRYCFSDGLATHRLWVVNDKVSIRAIAEDFADRKLYIADGHHRYETALNFRSYCRENSIYCPGSDYVMMMLADIDNSGLEVIPTHRIISGITDFNAEEVISSCSKYFTCESRDDITQMENCLNSLYSADKTAFGFYCGGKSWVLMTLKDSSVMDDMMQDKSEAYRRLDVSVLHSLILENTLGIDRDNMEKQVNLTYTHSLNEAVSAVDSGAGQCAFILNPTKIEEISAVAASGEKMPQKSTYFYPKIITGLVMNDLSK